MGSELPKSYGKIHRNLPEISHIGPACPARPEMQFDLILNATVHRFRSIGIHLRYC